MKTIYFVIPCYNEEQVLMETATRLSIKVESLINNKKINYDSKIIFVDDGSKDRTWEIIDDLSRQKGIFGGVKLSKNRGHQNALLGGILTVKNDCDAIISMDADLQDDIDAIDKFIDKYYDGCEVVYGVRSERKKDTFFKKHTAQAFYRLMSHLGVDIVYNHADYRLMSKRVIESLEEFKEVNLFLRGIVPMIGFKSDIVLYERNERFAGESKYPLKKMISFALEGITSFSVKPIRMVTTTGVIVFVTSLAMLLYCLLQWISGNTVLGWTTTVASIWAIGGIQILCIGIVGEYIGKIYMETKSRPKFIIEEYISNKEKDADGILKTSIAVGE